MNYREYDCIVDGTIEQCIEEIEVEDLGDHIYFGPQGEVLEHLNRFNTRWRANLEITKTFKWKRGTYQRVAELMNRQLGFERKPSGMYNFLSREDYFRRHDWGRVQNDLRNMDMMLYQLRDGGEVWLDDPSILVERKALYTNYISEHVETAQKLVDGLDIFISDIGHQLYVHPTSRSSKRYMLVNTFMLSPEVMKIYLTEGRNSTQSAEHIENIDCSLDIELNVISYPVQTMTRNREFNNPMFDTNVFGKVHQWDERGHLYFPYISGGRSWNDRDGVFGNSVCFGDDVNNINSALRSFNMSSFVLQLTNWATTYTNSTGPHHNIKTMYHGEPAKLSERYRSVFGTNRSEDCMYDPSGYEDYCDIHSCTFRATCIKYKQAYPKPVSPEEAEQMTLQWATRMGGVNNAAPTVIHSVNDDGQPTSTTPVVDFQPIQGDREQWNPEDEARINDEMDEADLEELRQHVNEQLNEEE